MPNKINEVHMISRKEIDSFIDKLDKMIPLEIQEAMQADLEKMNPATVDWIDFQNLQERARVLTIKDAISSTHKWTKVVAISSNGGRKEEFWCEECGIHCSRFEHINTISIISKVKDNRPTYTVHNSYLMFTCSEVQLLKRNCERYCYECGMGEFESTSDCSLIDVTK